MLGILPGSFPKHHFINFMKEFITLHKTQKNLIAFRFDQSNFATNWYNKESSTGVKMTP